MAGRGRWAGVALSGMVMWLSACLPASGAALPTVAALAPTLLAPRPTAAARPTGTASPAAIPATYTLPASSATPTGTPPPAATPTSMPTPACTGDGQVATGHYPSRLFGPERAYRIYLPPCYGQDGYTYPTLYLLHGNNMSDAKWDELGADEVAEAGIHAGIFPPFLIVMPDGGYPFLNTSGGPGSFEAVIVSELLPFVEQQYCAWPAREGRAIGGLSRGGYWSLEIAFRWPALFGSAGGHSAALLDLAAGPDLNPQYTALSRDLDGLRIYLDAGSEDTGVLPNLRRLHQDMEDAGIPHAWHLNPGSHSDSYWSGQLGNYLRWYTRPWTLSRQAYPPCSS